MQAVAKPFGGKFRQEAKVERNGVTHPWGKLRGARARAVSQSTFGFCVCVCVTDGCPCCSMLFARTNAEKVNGRSGQDGRNSEVEMRSFEAPRWIVAHLRISRMRNQVRGCIMCRREVSPTQI